MPESTDVSEDEHSPEPVGAGESPGSPQVGRDRLLRALRTPGRGQVVVALILALVGFAAVTQVRANTGDNTYQGYREQDLIDVLNGLAGTTQRARDEIDRLERTRDALRSTTRARQAALAAARSQSDTLAILAGQVPVTGPGVRITIREVTGQVSVESVLDLVEELRTAGAEAIQINGTVRLVAQSSFEQGVDGIEVDGTPVSPPYVVDVIGEPHALSGAITFLDGPEDELQDDGAEVGVDSLSSLDITSVRTSQPGDTSSTGGQ